MEIIRKAQLEDALNMEYRQYLTGHLKRPQPYLSHIDDDVEVGISHYKSFTADTPHVHPVATEYTYLLEGSMKIRLLDGSEQEYTLYKGDFFVLRPGTPYATKNCAGTRVLFIKVPGVDDKTLVEVDAKLKEWFLTWE